MVRTDFQSDRQQIQTHGDHLFSVVPGLNAKRTIERDERSSSSLVVVVDQSGEKTKNIADTGPTVRCQGF